MDWLNEFPPASGFDKVVGEMAKRLLEGPVVFRSPYWDGDIKIETLNDYCAWARFASRINNERGAEGRALEIWEEEKSRKPIESYKATLENPVKEFDFLYRSKVRRYSETQESDYSNI